MSKQGKAKVLTAAQFKRVVTIQQSTTHPARNIALLYFSFGLGLRAKELAQLSVGDVLNSDGYSIKSEVVLTSAHTKGGTVRTVYLTNQKVITALRSYLDQRSDLYLTRPLFQSQKNGRFTPNTMQMLFKKMYREAGLESASSHSGRRTFATRLIENGADIKAVSRLMGHASIRITAEYIQDNPDRLRRLTATAL